MKDDKVYFDLQRVPLKSEREEIRNRRKKVFLIILICLFCFTAGIGGGYLLHRVIHPSYKVDANGTMGEIEYWMNNYWLYSDQHEDLTKEMEDKAFYGMTAFDNDIYTSYMSDEEMNQFSTSINMNYVGIGVEYTTIDGLSIVKTVFKNSPAEKAGILPGDILEEVDGTPISGLTADEIRERVIGVEGTPVVIGVVRSGTKMDLTCIRGTVDSSVYAYRVDDYVIMQLKSFGMDTARESIKYLDEYTDLHKIIIDLRGDGGGYQTSVREMCGLFIGDDKVYLRQRDVKGYETADYTMARKYYDNFTDIVLLVDENTASAAEVFVICLKECHPNVTIVGTTTFGKGVIQTNYQLGNGGALKMTQYYWLSPNGVSIHGEGIHPDVEVKLADIAYEYYYQMEEGESYGYDSVSDYTRIAQLGLDYLGYDIGRTDGYFDRDFEASLLQYKKDNSLNEEAILDEDTYQSIISSVLRQLYTDPEKDYQLVKAKEVLNGN